MGFSRTRLRRGHLVTLVFLLTVLPLSGLAWAAWQLIAMDHVLERQQREDRLDRAAEQIIPAIRMAVSESERALAAGQESWPAGAIAVTMRDGGITVTPPSRIAFLPVSAPLPGEHAVVRGIALLSRGQALARSGHDDAALQVFAELREQPAFSVADTDVPSWLAARYWRAQILEKTGKAAALREEALRMAADMRTLAPHLSGPVYQVYADDVARWSRSPPPAEALSLSLAVDVLWRRWSTNGVSVDSSGRERLGNQGDPIVLWQTSRDTLRALIATQAFVDAEWILPARAVAREEGVSIMVGPRPSTVPFAIVSRTVSAGELPWPVTVSDVSGGRDATFRQRRNIIIASFVTLVVVVTVAGYAVIRSISRELAVARQQSDFVAAVSHEFRTPLTSLKQFVELLREQPSLDEARRRQCYDAQARSVDRLSRLVESLLDFGRLDAGTQPYRLAPQDCAALAQSVVADFNEHAQNAGYRVEVATAHSAMVNVDADAVSRALWNLLDNAMKYSPHCTTIEVGVRSAHATVCIDVRDRGMGIGPEESRDIFRRFHRGAEARSRGIRGTGLGLAMVIEIMQAHGGRVDLDSQPGQGSTFTLVFPVVA